MACKSIAHAFLSVPSFLASSHAGVRPDLGQGRSPEYRTTAPQVAYHQRPIYPRRIVLSVSLQCVLIAYQGLTRPSRSMRPKTL